MSNNSTSWQALLETEGLQRLSRRGWTTACSHMTVRRDIAVLEEAGLVYTVPGGARIASHLNSEPSHLLKAEVEQPQKQAIARRAAQELSPGMSIYLDAGTTTLSIVPHVVALTDMTVVSNDFEIVRELAGAAHVNVVHTGGQLDHANLASVGARAATTLSHVVLDIAFILRKLVGSSPRRDDTIRPEGGRQARGHRSRLAHDADVRQLKVRHRRAVQGCDA